MALSNLTLENTLEPCLDDVLPDIASSSQSDVSAETCIDHYKGSRKRSQQHKSHMFKRRSCVQYTERIDGAAVDENAVSSLLSSDSYEVEVPGTTQETSPCPATDSSERGPIAYTEDTAFRQFSRIIDSSKDNRSVPPQLRCNDIGEPETVWQLLCNKEKVYKRDPLLLDYHPTLNASMRVVLLDWIMEVCEAEKLHRETFYLTVDYVDRFLSKSNDVEPISLQLIGVTALVIATKVEEIYPPRVETLASYTDGACCEAKIHDCELLMLQILKWSLSPVTPLHWLMIYMQLMCNYEENENKIGMGDQHSLRAVEEIKGTVHVGSKPSCLIPTFLREDFINLAQVLDLSMMDYKSLSFDYSVLAAAVFFCCFEPEVLVQQITGYKTEQLIGACDFVLPYLRVCESNRPPGDPVPVFSNVPSDDSHNIQTHIPDIQGWMEKAKVLRDDINRRRQSNAKLLRRNALSSADCVSHPLLHQGIHENIAYEE